MFRRRSTKGTFGARAPMRAVGVRRTYAPRTRYATSYRRAAVRSYKGTTFKRPYKRQLLWARRRPVVRRGGIRGHGDYIADIGADLGRSAGSVVSGALKDVGSIFGVGDYTLGKSKSKSKMRYPKYKVTKNSLAPGKVVTGNKVPKFTTKGRANIFVHREFLTDVIAADEEEGGPREFKINSYPINPGIDTTFPWLSQIAANYEQYKIHGMVFEFRSSYSDTVVGSETSGTLGSIIMATEYNSDRPVFQSKAEMENHEYSVSGRPADSFLHPIECANKESPFKVMYIRSHGENDEKSLTLTDLGRFSIASDGIAVAGDKLGELWVTYHVEFLKPKMNAPSADESDPTVFYHTPVGTLCTAQFPMGNPWPQFDVGSSFQFDVTVQEGKTVLAFPSNYTEGQFIGFYCVNGEELFTYTGDALSSPCGGPIDGGDLSNNVTNVPLFRDIDGSLEAVLSPKIGDTNKMNWCIFAIRIDGSNAQFQWDDDYYCPTSEETTVGANFVMTTLNPRVATLIEACNAAGNHTALFEHLKSLLPVKSKALKPSAAGTGGKMNKAKAARIKKIKAPPAAESKTEQKSFPPPAAHVLNDADFKAFQAFKKGSEAVRAAIADGTKTPPPKGWTLVQEEKKETKKA